MFINPTLISKLQKLRDLIGKSININSGCRCLTYNRSSYVPGSVDTSSHTGGFAADLRIPEDMTLTEFYEAVKISGLFFRIGLYDGFIHVDIDPNKPPAEWDNRT